MPDNITPPRRGFTQSISEERPTAYPVVVGINHSGLSALALKRAVDEAAHRSVQLHVVVGGPVREAVESVSTTDREMHTITSILKNRHVTVWTVDAVTPDALIDYCKDVGASLLVIGCADDVGSDELESPKTAHRLVDDASCDVLVVHADEQHGHH